MYNYPPEIISLPTKGWFYPTNHPFSCGTVLLNPMTGYHEDILTNINLVNRGEALKLFLKDIIVDKSVDIYSLIAIDVHGILLACRILSYGSSLKLKYTCPSCEHEQEISVNLLSFKSNDISESFKINRNEFYYQFPKSGDIIKYKLLTLGEDLRLPNEFTWLDTLKTITMSVNDNGDVSIINDFLENRLTASESKEFKEYHSLTTPYIHNKFVCKCEKCENTQKSFLPINGISVLGLEPKDKSYLHDEIFTLSYYSEGGFTQDMVYNLPVSIRKYYINKLVEAKKKEKDQVDKVNDHPTDSSPKISKPNINTKSKK